MHGWNYTPHVPAGWSDFRRIRFTQPFNICWEEVNFWSQWSFNGVVMMFSPLTKTHNLVYLSHTKKQEHNRGGTVPPLPSGLLKNVCHMLECWAIILQCGECAGHILSTRAFWSSWVVYLMGFEGREDLYQCTLYPFKIPGSQNNWRWWFNWLYLVTRLRQWANLPKHWTNVALWAWKKVRVKLFLSGIHFPVEAPRPVLCPTPQCWTSTWLKLSVL